jgi:hypothetical protein
LAAVIIFSRVALSTMGSKGRSCFLGDWKYIRLETKSKENSYLILL